MLDEDEAISDEVAGFGNQVKCMQKEVKASHRRDVAAKAAGKGKKRKETDVTPEGHRRELDDSNSNPMQKKPRTRRANRGDEDINDSKPAESSAEASAPAPGIESVVEASAPAPGIDEAVVEASAPAAGINEAVVEASASAPGIEAVEASAPAPSIEAVVEASASAPGIEAVEASAPAPSIEAVVEASAPAPGIEAVVEASAPVPGIEAVVEASAPAPAEQGVRDNDLDEQAAAQLRRARQAQRRQQLADNNAEILRNSGIEDLQPPLGFTGKHHVQIYRYVHVRTHACTCSVLFGIEYSIL